MQKTDLLNKIVNTGVVAVVRGKSPEIALKTVDACIAGGITGIELAFTVPHADQVISQINEKYANNPQICLGAGTVLDPITARIAIMAGSQFIVSPTFDKHIAKLCNLYQIPYLPGCMSATEIQIAMSYGSDIVKVFPGNVLGQAFVKSLKVPIPFANLMPTGGVDLENMHTWFENGVVVVGAGSNLVGPADQGDFTQVTKNAVAYRAEVDRIKSLQLQK